MTDPANPIQTPPLPSTPFPPLTEDGFARLAKTRGFVRRTSPGRALRALGRDPDLLVDIGVCAGTGWFYSAYPSRPFLLVDPARDCEANLAARPARYDFVAAGLSDRAGELELIEQGARSTVHTRTALTARPERARYTVPVTTFEAMIARQAPQARRIGVKIDVEGHELAVIRGIGAAAPKIDFLIVEIGILNRFDDMPAFAETIGALAGLGLRFYNLLNPVAPRPRRFHDCLFLPECDPAFDGAA